MPFTITKQFTFEAAHALPQLPPSHKCHKIHGHSYRVELALIAPDMDNRGFAGGVDYADLDLFGNYLEQEFDHQFINGVLPGTFTTAEALAKHFYGWCKPHWPTLAAVRVSETAKVWVEYRQ